MVLVFARPWTAARGSELVRRWGQSETTIIAKIASGTTAENDSRLRAAATTASSVVTTSNVSVPATTSSTAARRERRATTPPPTTSGTNKRMWSYDQVYGAATPESASHAPSARAPKAGRAAASR